MANEIIVLLGYQIIAFAIALIFGKRSQIDAWAEENPTAAAILKFLRATSIDPWMFLQALSLLVNKQLPKAPTDTVRMARSPDMFHDDHPPSSGTL